MMTKADTLEDLADWRVRAVGRHLLHALVRLVAAAQGANCGDYEAAREVARKGLGDLRFAARAAWGIVRGGRR